MLLCRWWLSRDPSGEGSGINLFEYVRNNPISGIDPIGLCDCESLQNQIDSLRHRFQRDSQALSGILSDQESSAGDLLEGTLAGGTATALAGSLAGGLVYEGLATAAEVRGGTTLLGQLYEGGYVGTSSGGGNVLTALTTPGQRAAAFLPRAAGAELGVEVGGHIPLLSADRDMEKLNQTVDSFNDAVNDEAQELHQLVMQFQQHCTAQ